MTIYSGMLIAAFLGLLGSNDLTGRWETKTTPAGIKAGIVFHPDNSFEGYINGKPYLYGTYRLEKDIISFTDDGCSGPAALYKLRFFSNSDSLQFIEIDDRCPERKIRFAGVTLGRVPNYIFGE